MIHAACSLRSATAGCLLSAWLASAQVVHVIPGYEVTFPGNRFGVSVVQGVPQHYVKIPAAKEYWLDYQIWFENDFEWVKGGKLPGLVGGTHTSGCDAIEATGWSARFMWHENGGGHFYYYHQNRQSNCGDARNFANGRTFKKMAWNRITERVVVNAPGQANGLAQAWLNGEKVVDVGNVRWRGNVSDAVAQVDQVSLQTFYGGSTQDWAPSRTTHARFSSLVVRKDQPDFGQPFDPDPIVTVIGPRRRASAGSRILSVTDLAGRGLPYSTSPSEVSSPLVTVIRTSEGGSLPGKSLGQ